MKPPEIGDYVLASTCPNGDPMDPWFVGFFAGMRQGYHVPPRFLVSDMDGRDARPSGYVRLQKISAARGKWILEHAKEIQESGKSLFYFARCKMTEEEV